MDISSFSQNKCLSLGISKHITNLSIDKYTSLVVDYNEGYYSLHHLQYVWFVLVLLTLLKKRSFAIEHPFSDSRSSIHSSQDAFEMPLVKISLSITVNDIGIKQAETDRFHVHLRLPGTERSMTSRNQFVMLCLEMPTSVK